MILVDESKLVNGCIVMIGEAYGLKYDYNNYNEESYSEYLDKIVEMLEYENTKGQCKVCLW